MSQNTTKAIGGLPRILNESNINEVIKDYLKLMDSIPVTVEADTIFELLSKIKRHTIGSGPYPNVSLFEAANRIMTDLTILYGVKELLDGKIPEIRFDEYKVEFGNEHNNEHDIEAADSTKRLVGEAFNVAATFFQTKKAASLKKMREDGDKSKMILLLYNADAVGRSYKPEKVNNEYHLPVAVILPTKVGR